jgi:hypothetical protein
MFLGLLQALICALKAVFLYKTGQTQEALTWANNTVQMLQNLPKPVHCFLMVIVGSNVNEILVRNGGHSSSNALTNYLDELGNVWPLAKHYRDKRIEFYGSAAALFHLGEGGMTDILATTSRPVRLLLPGAPPPVAPSVEGGGWPSQQHRLPQSPPPSQGPRSPHPSPASARTAAPSSDAASVLLDPEPLEPSAPMAAQALASVRFGTGGPVSPTHPTPTHCSICGCAGFECGCEANRSKALYHLARESKKRALAVPEVLKPPSFSKLRATVTTTERTRKRSSAFRPPSEDMLEFEDDDLDELLFTFVPDALGSDSAAVPPVVSTPTTSTSSGSGSGGLGSPAALPPRVGEAPALVLQQSIAPSPASSFQGSGYFTQLSQSQVPMIPLDASSGPWVVMMPQSGQSGYAPQMIPLFQPGQSGMFSASGNIPNLRSVTLPSPPGVVFSGFPASAPVQAFPSGQVPVSFPPQAQHPESDAFSQPPAT